MARYQKYLAPFESLERRTIYNQAVCLLDRIQDYTSGYEY